MAFSKLFATGKTVTLSGNVGATTLTVAQIASHTHTIDTAHSGWGTASGGNASVYTNYPTGAAGGSKSHTHTLSGKATISLAVKYTDVIICAKA